MDCKDACDEDPRYVDRDAIAAIRPRFERVRCAGLYVAGSLEALAGTTIAIVGTRVPSDGGRRLAESVAASLARAGVCIISGLALGIDGAAHRGAVNEGEPTIGVLGGGHRHFYPIRNRELARSMIACGGAVLSPFPPDASARPHQFVQRNGIIAALADAVVVVEAAERSGSLNTAGWAGDLGLPVFAFPGDVNRPKVAGCHALIRDGATLVRDAHDILEGIGISARRAVAFVPAEHEPPASASPLEQRLLKRLTDGETSIEELANEHPGKMSDIAAALVLLEMRGLIEARAGSRYAPAQGVPRASRD